MIKAERYMRDQWQLALRLKAAYRFRDVLAHTGLADVSVILALGTRSQVDITCIGAFCLPGGFEMQKKSNQQNRCRRFPRIAVITYLGILSTNILKSRMIILVRLAVAPVSRQPIQQSILASRLLQLGALPML